MSKTPLAALALSAAASLAIAQEPAAPASKAEARTPRIGVIDLGRVSAESLMGKGYTAQIEALDSEIKSEGTKKQTELQKIDASIKALQDELEKQQSVLSPEAADRKRQDIVKRSRERQAFLEDGQAEIQRMRERAQAQAEALQGEFQQRIRPHIDAVAKDKGLDIIINSQVALAVSKDFDISRDVIVKADDAERTAKAKPGASSTKPAASTATPAPSPTPKP